MSTLKQLLIKYQTLIQQEPSYLISEVEKFLSQESLQQNHIQQQDDTIPLITIISHPTMLNKLKSLRVSALNLTHTCSVLQQSKLLDVNAEKLSIKIRKKYSLKDVQLPKRYLEESDAKILRETTSQDGKFFVQESNGDFCFWIEKDGKIERLDNIL